MQANPWVPGETIYCNETGGDAPQRMWFVRADGTDNRPLCLETPDEWVTHEVVVDRDHVMLPSWTIAQAPPQADGNCGHQPAQQRSEILGSGPNLEMKFSVAQAFTPGNKKRSVSEPH